MQCNITGCELGAPIFRSQNTVSITSLMQSVKMPTEVYYSSVCGHIRTKQLDNLDEFYDQDYEILLNSEEEDQLYRVENGKNIFRSEHQANTLLKKVNFVDGAKLLDYGCAKAGTTRVVSEERPDIDVYLFDVSRMHESSWQKFVKSSNYASHTLKKEWNNTFDVVTSYFAMEHVLDLKKMLSNIHKLLKSGGIFYFIVPDVMKNIADFIVIDHINHFTSVSLKYLLSRADFEVIEIDENAHDSAFVVKCKKGNQSGNFVPSDEELKTIQNKVTEMSRYWNNIQSRIREFESNLNDTDKAVIYGSGFYGTFISTVLTDLNNISCFVDTNPYRHNVKLFDKPIVPPEQIPLDTTVMYVGLNPSVAKTVIEELDTSELRELEYCFL
ncbi:MAG: hypothetical protein CL600_14975 [Alteromonas sp.]|nr:hypothetical protein [Alteromonas sp.]